MEKYEVSVFNTITKQYEMVEVSKEVYEVYKRTEWQCENDDRRFCARQMPFSDLHGNQDDCCENYREFIAQCESDFEDAFDDESVEVEPLVKRAMSILNEAERTLIEELYFKKRTEADIAREMKVSQQAIHKRKKKILLKMRKEIEDFS